MRATGIDEVLTGASRWCVVTGDCLALQSLPPALLLTDPPWGVAVRTDNAARGRGGRPYEPTGRAVDFPPVAGDDRPFDPRPFLGFERAVMWGANHYADQLPRSHCWFAWDRKTTRGADSDITDVELAWVRGLPYKTTRLFRHMWAGFQRDSETGEQVLHPTQKPIALFAWCLTFFPNADVVLDPFCGSGSSGVAAMRAGRRFIGIECVEGYADLARERLSAEVSGSTLKASRAGQQPLFGDSR
jgi:site-specific DNA-methyltransferase (adenine-specific)